MANDFFFHECRANGMVFKTAEDWWKWLQEHNQDVHSSVAEHFGFKFNINDVCINPNTKAKSKIDIKWYYVVKTARTQYGWIWGYDISTGDSGGGCGASYPSRYDNKVQFFETESEALIDGLSFIITQLDCCKVCKNRNILLYYAKKQRMDIKHPQLDLFANSKTD